MPNRFSGRIRRGEIASVGELKTEFKALAKRTHPDLAGGERSGDEFAALRAEYEAALRDFDRHRFGLGSARSGGAPSGGAYGEASGEGGNPVRGRRAVHDRGAFYASLAALRKRGFPKLPRHEKERMRYEYARYLLLAALEAWDEAYVGLFRGFEAALLEGEAVGAPGGSEAAAAAAAEAEKARDEALAILDAVLDAVLHATLAQHKNGIAHLVSSIALDLERLALGRERGGARMGRATELSGGGSPASLVAFLEILVRDLALGPAPSRRG